jgi:hypothetical protein
MMNEPGDRPLTTSDLASPTDPRSGTAPTAPERPSDQIRTEGHGSASGTSVPVQAQGPAVPASQQDDQSAPLFAPERARELRSQWDSIQTGFVDEPRKTVEQADTLVAEVIQQLARSFADEKLKLEQQWGRGNDVSTEDLRLALRHYRSFFDRLLSV